ncbi:Uncharacterised protein [uncultured Comamonas sp.]|nr:Uncharacterised protein [uncultured Comamonas sp.]
MPLPHDIARCPGVGSDDENEGWREGCETCLRRTKPGDERYQSWMQPPPIIAFFCEYLIEPGEHETLRPEPIARR